MNKYHLIYLTAYLITGVSQILLKTGANRYKDISKISIFFNIYSILGYALMFCTTIMTLYAFKFIEVKSVIILMPFLYIFLYILSFFILKEKISFKHIIGTVIIVTGVIIFNL